MKETQKEVLYKKVAEELDLPYSEVSGVVNEVFKGTRDYLANPHLYEYPGLMLTKFGSFKILSNNLNKRISRLRVDDEELEKWEKLEKRVQDFYYYKKADNLKQYKQNKNGQRTEQQEIETNHSQSESNGRELQSSGGSDSED